VDNTDTPNVVSCGRRKLTGGEHVHITENSLELVAGVRVQCVRTLRIPERGTYPLPPGLGTFPLRRVDDYAETVPEEWLRRGGVMLPVYQREALWLSFTAREPAALQVGVGKVCAVSGKPWRDTLDQDPQNYVVLPNQPWLDGINAGNGFIRQFVAVPLGLGATVEGQVTGEEQWGGAQLAVHPLTDSARQEWQRDHERLQPRSADGIDWMGVPGAAAPSGAPSYGGAPSGPAPSGPAPAGVVHRQGRARAMGLGAGGRMRQEVYADTRPVTDYTPDPQARVFVHLVAAADWRRITGENPPPTPVSAQTYAAHGLPWFDYYNADSQDLPAAPELSAVQPTGQWFDDDKVYTWTPPEQLPVIPLGDPKPVHDGEW
jgi:hypothetical protein